MKNIFFTAFVCVMLFVFANNFYAQGTRFEQQKSFRVLVLTERGGQHGGFTDAGLKWLAQKSKEMNFEMTEINDTKPIDEDYIKQYQLFIQLDYPPYHWTETAQKAFVKYIDEGWGGWIGFHHATLLGEFDGFPMWQWFSDFMGGIRFKNYIAPLASGKVRVEKSSHPVMQGLKSSFVIPDDEWYTFDKSPRNNVSVLANVDESSYQPDSAIKMGDHPVVWTNQSKKARNVYFLIGHSKKLYDSNDFKAMFSNAIAWAAGKNKVFDEKSYPANYAGNRKRFKALVYYSDNVEEAHRQFAHQGVEFFKRLNYGEGFILDISTNFADYPYEKLKDYNVVVMLNTMPAAKEQRDVFEKYMENGGGWVGFHAAAYNDKNTKWQWLVNFLGGGVFYCNNWAPQPVKLQIDNPYHAVTKNLPDSFIAPESEWYQWTPSPRENPGVEVLLTLSPDNYPLGIKDVVNFGDFPVVWTNKNYRMIYLNMGHGDDEFSDATQKLLFVNAFRWVVSEDKKGNPFE
jgi:type 1 glutamine amidotransferase